MVAESRYGAERRVRRGARRGAVERGSTVVVVVVSDTTAVAAPQRHLARCDVPPKNCAIHDNVCDTDFRIPKRKLSPAAMDSERSTRAPAFCGRVTFLGGASHAQCGGEVVGSCCALHWWVPCGARRADSR